MIIRWSLPLYLSCVCIFLASFSKTSKSDFHDPRNDIRSGLRIQRKSIILSTFVYDLPLSSKAQVLIKAESSHPVDDGGATATKLLPLVKSTSE